MRYQKIDGYDLWVTDKTTKLQQSHYVSLVRNMD